MSCACCTTALNPLICQRGRHISPNSSPFQQNFCRPGVDLHPYSTPPSYAYVRKMLRSGKPEAINWSLGNCVPSRPVALFLPVEIPTCIPVDFGINFSFPVPRIFPRGTQRTQMCGNSRNYQFPFLPFLCITFPILIPTLHPMFIRIPLGFPPEK